jgi:hypothetical protein
VIDGRLTSPDLPGAHGLRARGQDMVILSQIREENKNESSEDKTNCGNGGVASDSAGEHDGLLSGDPQWQPA